MVTRPRSEASRSRLLRRRGFVALGVGLVATLLVAGRPDSAEDVIELDWDDLIPGVKDKTLSEIKRLSVVEHGEISQPFNPTGSAEVTTEYNGRIVSLPGFIVPLDYSGAAVTSFILVPFVGACIHVPPPPANQLVYVTTQEPYESSGLFEPVQVTGMFGVAATSTQIAEIGYAISADRIEPFEI